jgi:hypothetical protein
MSEDAGTYKRLLTNREWKGFSNKVKTRDGFRCTVCKRSGNEVVLQAHHLVYKPNLKPWEYPICDLVTVCRGCHAREHGIIQKTQPHTGWELIEVNDLGELCGKCQNEGCGASIRYEYYAFHPQWGTLVTGSSCINHLTVQDQKTVSRVIKLSQKIKRLVECGGLFQTELDGTPYFSSRCKFGEVRVYGHENQKYAVQVHKYRKPFTEIKSIKATSLPQAIESGCIWLMGLCSKHESDRDLYRSMWAAKEA